MGRLGAGCRCTGGDRWKVIGAIVAEHGTSLGILSLGGFQVLVGDADLRFQSIELGVLKYFPPVTAEILVIRLGRFPIANLFIRWRNFRLRPLIVRSDRATTQLEHSYP